MIDKYTDLIVTEISSVSFDDINSKIQLPKDICKLICEYTGDECAIMHLLYLIRREYYWKYKICHIIFLCYLVFHTCCTLWIFYYLISTYVKFYQDTFRDKKWDVGVGCDALQFYLIKHCAYKRYFFDSEF